MMSDSLPFLQITISRWPPPFTCIKLTAVLKPNLFFPSLEVRVKQCHCGSALPFPFDAVISSWAPMSPLSHSKHRRATLTIAPLLCFMTVFSPTLNYL